MNSIRNGILDQSFPTSPTKNALPSCYALHYPDLLVAYLCSDGSWEPITISIPSSTASSPKEANVPYGMFAKLGCSTNSRIAQDWAAHLI